MLLRSFNHKGMILRMFPITSSLWLIQESQSTSFYRPNKITLMFSICSGFSYNLHNENKNVNEKEESKENDKSSKLDFKGTLLGVLPKSKLIIFTKSGEVTVKFYNLMRGELELVSEYKPKYNVKD